MFDLNEKVILIASSYYKKTGPRKNSIGYIAPFSKTFKILNNPNVAAMSAEIKFLCYGNEKRNRFETKEVLLTFPILQNDIHNRLEKFIHVINFNKVDNWNKIRVNLNTSENIPIVIAVPVRTPETNLKYCSNQEFSCWFENFLMSQQMNIFVNEALTSDCFSQNSITKHNLLLLQEMMVDRNTRQAVIKTICESVLRRSEWVNMLRMITITIERTSRKIIANRLFYNFKGGKEAITAEKLYTLLIPHIFCQTFRKFKNMYTKHKDLNKVIRGIESTKAIMLGLPNKKSN